jgi:hypothetical protein
MGMAARTLLISIAVVALLVGAAQAADASDGSYAPAAGMAT